MKRFMGLALAGIALSGCSDRVTMPTSSLTPSAPLRNVFGDPPPPPIGGDDGYAVFDTRSDASIQSVARTTGTKGPSAADPIPCAAATSFHFAYKYLINSQNNNAWLHINPDDPSRQIEIHQTDKKIDAHGVIVGPGFTYTIKDAIAGQIVDPEQHVPGAVYVQLTGTLKTGGTSCTTTATFNAYLSGQLIGD